MFKVNNKDTRTTPTLKQLNAGQEVLLPQTSAKNTDELTESLEKASNNFFQWFKDHLLKGNHPDKCNIVLLNKTHVNIGEFNIESSDCEELLGAKIDNKLTFDCHLSDICKKASRKINVSARVAPYINLGKRHMNSFCKSQLM